MGELAENQVQTRRDALASALETVESQASPPPSPDKTTAPAESTPQPQQAAGGKDGPRGTDQAKAKSAPDRAPDGKFVKAEEVKAETTAQKKAREYPGTWKKDYEPVYRKLEANPEFSSVLDEIERRENDMRRGIEQYKSQADFATRFQNTLKPFEPTLQQLGLAPDVAIQRLLQADQALRSATPAQRHQLAAQFLRGYGIDLPVPEGEQTAPDPNLTALQEKIQRVEQQNQTLLSSFEQQMQAEAEANIAQFSKDKPLMQNDEVRQEMGRLINAGICSTVPEAYDRAIYGLPAIREQVLAEQQAKAETERKQKAQAEAERAKTASVQVKGAPTGGAQSASLKAKDRRGQLAEALNQRLS